MVNPYVRLSNLKFLPSRYEDMNGDAKYGVVRGDNSHLSHPGSSATHHSLDRIRTTIQHSHKLCVYIVPFTRYSDLFVESCRFSPTQTCVCRSRRWADPIRISRPSYDPWHQSARKLNSHGLSSVRRCLRDPTLSVLLQYRLVTDI